MKIEKELAQKNQELENELKKAKILIKIQKKLLNNFCLHDDAGTAYIYLGLQPEEIERIIETEPDLENLALVDTLVDTLVDKYNYILNLLFEIECIQDNDKLNQEIKKKIEDLQDHYMNLYHEERKTFE